MYYRNDGPRKVTFAKIADELRTHCGDHDRQRAYFYTAVLDHYDRLGSIFISLEGSPPRGHALITAEPATLGEAAGAFLDLYDGEGRRWRAHERVILDSADYERALAVAENRSEGVEGAKAGESAD